jgi:hypothetical protein
MGKNQALPRLLKGAVRDLSNSERMKGYLFITMDNNLLPLINKEFVFFILNEEIKNKKLDKYGRIYLGNELTKKLGSNKISIKIIEKKIVINFHNGIKA